MMTTKYTWFGLRVTPLFDTLREIPGGQCVDILIDDVRSTIKESTVNLRDVLLTETDTAGDDRCLDCNVPTTNKVFCPRCLDADSSIQPHCPCGAVIIGPGAYCTSRCVRAYAPKVASATVNDEATIAFLAEVEASGDDSDDCDSVAAASVPQQKPVFIELRHVTHDHAEMCVSCNSKAVGKCRCGRRVCGGCVDGETGLCAYCDDVVEDVGVDMVEARCYA